MILSAHQPAYLPWLGYFDKVSRSDVFVFLDDVQFEKNSFTNRNKVKTQQGPVWLTIPVVTKGHTSSTMLETRIDNSQNWRSKHLKTIGQSYAKAPRFKECFPKLERLYATEHDLLANLCFDHLTFWLQELGIGNQVVRQSALPVTGVKSELVLALCRHFGAKKYISGALGKDYLEIDAFREAAIEVEFQDYRHPSYPQLHGEFLPLMGILDLWLNTDRFDVIGGRA